jgi:hypothetical protein
MAERLPDKFDNVERKRQVRFQQSRDESQSYAEMKTPKSTSKNIQPFDVEKRTSTLSRPK